MIRVPYVCHSCTSPRAVLHVGVGRARVMSHSHGSLSALQKEKGNLWRVASWLRRSVSFASEERVWSHRSDTPCMRKPASQRQWRAGQGVSRLARGPSARAAPGTSGAGGNEARANGRAGRVVARFWCKRASSVGIRGARERVRAKSMHDLDPACTWRRRRGCAVARPWQLSCVLFGQRQLRG